MNLTTLTRKTPRLYGKRVGRGGKRGKTSGRGTKGQKARAGHKIRPEVRDLIKKIPKLRGRGIHGLKPFREKPSIVNLEHLERTFSPGESITPAILLTRGLIEVREGKTPKVKILGNGSLTKKLIVSGCFVSGSARAAIEKAGGSIA